MNCLQWRLQIFPLVRFKLLIALEVNQANLIEESSAQINEIDSRSSLNLNKPTLTQSSATATATASGASPQVTNSTGYVATFMQPFNSITVTLTAGS